MRNSLTAENIEKIEKACFSEPWSLESVKSQLNSKGSMTLIKTVNGVIAGYVTGKRAGDETELYRIAVLPQYRGQGLAREMLTRFLEKAGGDVFLEVRSQNIPATELYKSAGFSQIAVRKNYYGDDDALIFKYEKINT